MLLKAEEVTKEKKKFDFYFSYPFSLL